MSNQSPKCSTLAGIFTIGKDRPLFCSQSCFHVWKTQICQRWLWELSSWGHEFLWWWPWLILMWSTKWWCIEIAVNRLTICKVMFLWSGSGKSRIYLSGHKRQKGQCTSPSTSSPSPSLSSSPSSRSSTLSSCFPSGHKCQEGQCTPADKGKKGYKCVCRTGYEGRFCETKSKLYQWIILPFCFRSNFCRNVLAVGARWNATLGKWCSWDVTFMQMRQKKGGKRVRT